MVYLRANEASQGKKGSNVLWQKFCQDYPVLLALPTHFYSLFGPVAVK